MHLNRKKQIGIFLVISIYPLFYLLDRFVVPSNSFFWQSYVEELLIPGLLLSVFLTSYEILFNHRFKTKTLLIVGAFVFIYSCVYELGRLIGLFSGTVDKLHLICYYISISIAILANVFMNSDPVAQQTPIFQDIGIQKES